MRMVISLLLGSALGLMSSTAHGQTVVKVHVTSVSGQSVFLDQGRNSGITPDLRVKFSPAGAAPVEGVVVDVASNSARVQMVAGNAPPPVGTAGELSVNIVAQPTTAPGAGTQPALVPPPHPPWTRDEGARSPDMPLLAPAFSKPPSERASTFHGRAYTDFSLSLDKGTGRDNKYFLSRTGTAFTLTNPFGQGGELRFDGEYDYRGQDIGDGSSRDQSDALIHEFSYAMGTEQYSPYRLEFGRFTSFYLPELGVMEGAEGALRLKNGLNIGAGGGAYLVASTDGYENEFKNLGFHVFADYASPDPMGFSGTVGYQKTWHDGSADRDLILGHASTWLSKSLWVYGMAQVDLYTSKDVISDSGVGLTNALFQTRYTPDNTQGASLSYSHYTWADIQAPDYPPAPLDLIQKGRVDRLELALWHDITKNLRPTVRVDRFMDQITDGYGGELDLDWTNIGGRPLGLHGAVFYAQGDVTDDWGFRTQATLRKGSFDYSLGYQFLQYNSKGTLQSSGDLIQNSVNGQIGWQVGQWYLNVTADYYFGDSMNTYTFGTYLEYRF